MPPAGFIQLRCSESPSPATPRDTFREQATSSVNSHKQQLSAAKKLVPQSYPETDKLARMSASAAK